MARYVIQSQFTGAFLSPSPDDGMPEWVISLLEAGVLDDIEHINQIVEDHCEPFHRAKVIDLHAL
ncbi:hypothetical protein [Comamonas aquatica]|jgi:hypothetical protein|uniref:hypothetical protein n=1 Tax=Comamonas aquatica TaxID=225991 RepID=UPI002449E645|nr:hypothetical protein [Comamonas aquatica]MDH0495794.1 hypothetical protein [Comamonas aquatica]